MFRFHKRMWVWKCSIETVEGVVELTRGKNGVLNRQSPLGFLVTYVVRSMWSLPTCVSYMRL